MSPPWTELLQVTPAFVEYCQFCTWPAGGTVAKFCPICRYLLVDQIDPTQHGIIDTDYAKEYAEP